MRRKGKHMTSGARKTMKKRKEKRAGTARQRGKAPKDYTSPSPEDKLPDYVIR
jgi:hypothetical protein